MISNAVILYGPPATGKDTINSALTAADPRYQQFHRIKCGTGRTTGYRMITNTQLRKLDPADILWCNNQYESTYIVDHSHLIKMITANTIPILHIGQPTAITVIQTRTPDIQWHVIELTCPRSEISRRLHQRNPTDVKNRLAVYDSTPRLHTADIHIDTSTIQPSTAAQQITSKLKSATHLNPTPPRG